MFGLPSTTLVPAAPALGVKSLMVGDTPKLIALLPVPDGVVVLDGETRAAEN